MHIKNGKILRHVNQEYMALDDSLSHYELQIDRHLLEDSKRLNSSLAR